MPWTTHTPMEHHHIHGCFEYGTNNPIPPRKILMRKLGLDTTSGSSEAVTSTTAESTDHNRSSDHPNLTPHSNSSNNNSSSNNNRTCGDDTCRSPTCLNRLDENSKSSAPIPTPVTGKPQSPATPPVVPDCSPKLGHGPTHLHRPTSNPTQAKCDQHDPATTVHGTRSCRQR